MLIVYIQIKNEVTFLFTKFLPYLWVNITRNIIHKICINICTHTSKIVQLIYKRKNIISDYHLQTQFLFRPKKNII